MLPKSSLPAEDRSRKQKPKHSFQMPSPFALVALPLHFKYHSGGFDGLTYSIPDEFASRALIGTRVSVPLGKRLTTGIIVGLPTKAPQGVERIRSITDILDAEPVFDEKFLE